MMRRGDIDQYKNETCTSTGNKEKGETFEVQRVLKAGWISRRQSFRLA